MYYAIPFKKENNVGLYIIIKKKRRSLYFLFFITRLMYIGYTMRLVDNKFEILLYT